jgi:hypothetical protein
MNYFLATTHRNKQLVPIDRNKNDKIILFTNARDEPRIREWAAHHLLLGFTCIYIFDHKSIVPLKHVFHQLDRRIFIEKCNLSIPPKIPLMKKAAMIAQRMHMDWMIYLDADEYLYLANPFHVKTLLKRFSFADSLAINWLMFGTNHHKKEPTDGVIMDHYTKSESSFNNHVKTFVRPHCVKNVITPHYYEIHQPWRMFSIDGKQMVPPFSFHTNSLPFDKCLAFIAHYIFQAEETYLQRKIRIPQDDTGTQREVDTLLHSRYNDVDNHLMREKYSHLIKPLLQKYTFTKNI